MMTDAVSDFFDRLAQRGHEPLLRKVSGKVRVDLTNGKQTVHWLIKIENGHLSVSQEDATAHCIVRTDRTVFDRVVRGELNAMAAMLRGVMEFEGDPELLVVFQRLLPGPPRSNDARRTAGYAKRRS